MGRGAGPATSAARIGAAAVSNSSSSPVQGTVDRPYWQTGLDWLGWLGAGQYATVNALKSMTGMNEYSPGEAFIRGLTRKDEPSTREFLEEISPDRDPEHIDAGDVAKSVGGFVGDVVIDPVTYLSLGTGAAVKLGGKALSRAGAAALRKATAEGAARGLGAAAAKEAAEKGIADAIKGGAKEYLHPGGLNLGLDWMHPSLPSVNLIRGDAVSRAGEALKIPRLFGRWTEGPVEMAAPRPPRTPGVSKHGMAEPTRDFLTRRLKTLEGQNADPEILETIRRELGFSPPLPKAPKGPGKIVSAMKYEPGLIQTSVEKFAEKADKVPLVGKLASGVARLGLEVADWMDLAFNAARGIPDELYREEKFGQFMQGAKLHNFINQMANHAKGLTTQDRQIIAHALEANNKAGLSPKAQGFFDWAQNAFEEMNKVEIAKGIRSNEVHNYVSHIYERMTPQQRMMFSRAVGREEFFTKERMFATLKEAQEKGLNPVEDIIKILAVRRQAHLRAVASDDLMKYAAKKFGVKGKVPAFTQVNYEAIKDYSFDPRIADHLNRLRKILADDNATRGFLSLWRPLQNLWKGAVTAWNPAFHTRNAISNTWQNYLAGVVSPRPYAQALEVMAGAGKNPGKKIRIGDLDWTLGDLRQLAEEYGVLRHGWLGGDIGETAAREAEKAVKPWAKASGAPRKAGRFVEDHARLSHFLDRIAKGDSLRDASWSVKKYLFDYSELTDLERGTATSWGLKDLFPFYTWSRKDIPLQISALITMPGKFAAVPKARSAIEGPEGTRTRREQARNMPPWLMEQFNLLLPAKDRSGSPLYARFGLPFEDLNRPFNPLQEGMELLTPLIKEPIQQAGNYDFYRRKAVLPYRPEVPREYQTTRTYPMMGLVPEPLRGWANVKEFPDKYTGGKRVEMDARLAHVAGALRPFSEAGKISDPNVDPIVRVLNYLSGAKFYPYEPLTEERRGQYERESIVRELRKARKHEGKRTR